MNALTLVEFLRETAAVGEAAKSFAGLDRRVVLLLRDAADELEKLKTK